MITMNSLHGLEPGAGIAFTVARGDRLRLVNRTGCQPIDLWAFNERGILEHLSMPHCRSILEKVSPEAGDVLYSNKARPILLFDTDNGGGAHNTLMTVCDETGCRRLGHGAGAGRCARSFEQAMAGLGLRVSRVPAPWTLFERLTIHDDGRLESSAAVTRPGDDVVIRAEMDVIFVLSLCPANRYMPEPGGIMFEIIEA